MAGLDALTELVERLGNASDDAIDDIKAELKAVAEGFDDRTRVIDHLEHVKKGLKKLELRWEVDEVIEAITPPPVAAEPEEEEAAPEADDPNRPLSMADLDLVYDDPRGLLLYKHKRADRWFLTQVNPYTGQPQTAELHPSEVAQLKTKLQGSPYWVLGSGGAA
jgi:hypothetical protein